ncbi:unnamed protein product, partial [Scytosiphon promiscuus]
RVGLLPRRSRRPSRRSTLAERERLSMEREGLLGCCLLWSPGGAAVDERERLPVGKKSEHHGRPWGASRRGGVAQRQRMPVERGLVRRRRNRGALGHPHVAPGQRLSLEPNDLRRSRRKRPPSRPPVG